MLVPKCLYRGQPGTSSTTLHTVTDAADEFTIVKNITIHNTDDAEQSIELYSVASGGSASAANKFFDGTIDAGKTVMIDCTIVLERNETLRAISSEASTVTLIVSGVIS